VPIASANRISHLSDMKARNVHRIGADHEPFSVVLWMPPEIHIVLPGDSLDLHTKSLVQGSIHSNVWPLVSTRHGQRKPTPLGERQGCRVYRRCFR
jgi:hypothetical protein